LAQQTLSPLIWSDELALAAQDHCRDTGSQGTTGHEGTDGSQSWDRIERYGQWAGSVAENVAYDTIDGSQMIMDLYVDAWVPNRAHRKNIVSAELRYTGIASC
jgi:uncharacterized protein YkwD